MRLLIVTHAGGSPYHGPNTRWYYLGRALQAYGVQTDIITSSYFHKYLSPPAVDQALQVQKIDGIGYHWIRTHPYAARGLGQVRNQLEFVSHAYRFSHRFSELQPDVVIASSPHPFVCYPAARIANLSKARFIFEVRDLWPEALLELGGFRKSHPYMLALKLAEKRGVSKADQVFSVKPGDIEYFQTRYCLPESRFSYMPNGFLPEPEPEQELPCKVQELRQRYHFLIVYIGAVSTYYRLNSLVRLAELLRANRDVGIIVVGTGDQEKVIQRQAKNSGLANFHMIGAVPKRQVPAILANADACYAGLANLKIHQYGISCNKIYEYMHARKPILGSYVAGYDPVAAAGCGVTAIPGREEILAETVQAMLSKPELVQKLGQKGREYFDRYHDFQVVAKNLHDKVLIPLIGRT